jgi:VWFA-related protein
MKRSVPVAACLCSALLGTAEIARSQTPLPVQPAPSFSAGVELVRLDVRVTDADGRPVRDLKQNEIEVIEDGLNRPVVLFQHIEEPAGSYADVASHTIAGEVSTNRGAARGHLYVLVFDQQHITPGNEQRARLAAQRFVRTRLKPGDRVAVHAIPGPGPQLGFTADASRAIRELERVRGLAETQQVGVLGTMTMYEAFQITRGDQVILQRVTDRDQQSNASDSTSRTGAGAGAGGGTNATPLSDLVREDARTIVDKADAQTRRMLAMLSDVLEPMRAIEGRKTVFLLSEGFHSDHVTRDMENVAAAAAQSYSVVYSIDLNRRGADPTADQPVGGDAAAEVLDKLNPLGSLAVETDGALILDAGLRADQVFAQAAGQSQDYYLVGFAPRDEALKDRGRYRRVSVRVRRRGASVSTRTGFALGDPSRTANRRQSIDRALAAPFPQQGLPVRYTTYVLGGSTPGVQRVIVSLDAELPIASGRQLRPAEIVFVVRAAGDGRVAASGTELLPLPERRAPGETVGTGTFHVQFELPPGDYLMRAVVREPGGLVGSADRRFTVHALDGPSVTSGDLVLSAEAGELPVRPAAYAGDGLSGVLDLYSRTPDDLHNAQVIVDLVPAGEEAAAVSGFADLQDVRAIASGAAREARVALPLTGIAPGTYVARATVKVGADTVSQVMREVEVRQGSRPETGAVAATAVFDPREIVNAAFAREYVRQTSGDRSVSPESTRQGLTRLASADYPGAIASFTAALDADGRNGPAAFFLGWAYHGAGDDRQAISAWRRAAFTEPTIIPAHLALADMYVRLAQPALAIQALRAGLTALPEAPELIDRLSRLETRRW